jgi:hypothetical protein
MCRIHTVYYCCCARRHSLDEIECLYKWTAPDPTKPKQVCKLRNTKDYEMEECIDCMWSRLRKAAALKCKQEYAVMESTQRHELTRLNRCLELSNMQVRGRSLTPLELAANGYYHHPQVRRGRSSSPGRHDRGRSTSRHRGIELAHRQAQHNRRMEINQARRIETLEKANRQFRKPFEPSDIPLVPLNADHGRKSAATMELTAANLKFLDAVHSNEIQLPLTPPRSAHDQEFCHESPKPTFTTPKRAATPMPAPLTPENDDKFCKNLYKTPPRAATPISTPLTPEDEDAKFYRELLAHSAAASSGSALADAFPEGFTVTHPAPKAKAYDPWDPNADEPSVAEWYKPEDPFDDVFQTEGEYEPVQWDLLG